MLRASLKGWPFRGGRETSQIVLAFSASIGGLTGKTNGQKSNSGLADTPIGQPDLYCIFSSNKIAGHNLIQLMHHFGNDARFSGSEEARRKQWFIKARQDQKLREDMTKEAAATTNVTAFAVTTVMATEAQIDAFELKLDRYDEATTAALMENQVEYEALQKRMIEIESRLEGIWQHANIMSDGRRVFLNADRTQAYDEFGAEVSEEEYAYDQFKPDHRPVDSFLDHLKERGAIRGAMADNRASREKIHEFDELKNSHREEIAKGGVTEERLNEMDDELLDAMPPEVVRHLSADATLSNAPDAKSNFTANANPAALTKTGAAITATPTLEN